MSLLYTCCVQCDSCGASAEVTVSTYAAGMEKHARIGAKILGWERRVSTSGNIFVAIDLCPECLKNSKESEDA